MELLRYCCSIAIDNVMGLLWECGDIAVLLQQCESCGSIVGLLRDYCENPVELLWYRSGISVGFLWPCRGISVVLLRDCCVIDVGLLWDSYGVAAGTVVLLLRYCCIVAVG